MTNTQSPQVGQDATPTQDTLKPCPFCNKQCAELVINQGDKWAHYEPSCLEVRTSYNVSDDAPWRAEAISAWNTRSTTITGWAAWVRHRGRRRSGMAESSQQRS